MAAVLSIYLRRLAPYFLLFFACECILRYALMIHEKEALSTPSQLLWVAGRGLASDLPIFLWIATGIAFYALLLPSRLWGTMLDRTFSTLIFLKITFWLILFSGAEWHFWKEYHARLDGRAVQMLWDAARVAPVLLQSQPLVLVFLAILGSSLAITLAIQPFLARSGASVRSAKRAMALAVIGVLAYAACALTSPAAEPLHENALMSEMAKNGVYTFSAALRDYDAAGSAPQIPAEQ